MELMIALYLFFQVSYRPNSVTQPKLHSVFLKCLSNPVSMRVAHVHVLPVVEKEKLI